ncbi:MAG: nucleotidyl transferase AbiEii/AbiGii toxin family protein [Bacteroidales bacterium]|nr:nucleotidyl transferase AbiEii/AbiGii toxin family protein [Bacteroidales bacterium]
MNRFFNIPENEKIRILIDATEKVNLAPFAVEKDWWVVQTLAILYETELRDYMVFKGGTSLSKAWEIISRFSEDVDLAVDRSFFGFSGELKKKERTKLRKTSKTYIIEKLFPKLQKAFVAKGLNNVKIIPEPIKTSDQDPVIINIYYPNVIESPSYLQARVQIEIGSRSLKEPYENREVLSIIDEIYPNSIFAQSAIFIPSVVPTRTFLEKIFLLHEEFQRPKNKIRTERLSRHLYDIYQIWHTQYARLALENRELYGTIVSHRYNYTRMGGVDYNLHQPKTIDFLPPQNLLSYWEDDYKTMQEQMIYGESPDFNQLISILADLKNYINSLNWIFEDDFPSLSKS